MAVEGIATSLGTLLLAAALLLPWLSVPGGALERAVLAQRGQRPVPTGSVFASDPVLAGALLLLLGTTTALTVLRLPRVRPGARLLAGARLTVGGGAALVLVLLFVRVLLARPGAAYTAVGTGPVLAAAGAFAALAASLPLGRIRSARPLGPLGDPWPRSRGWGAGSRTRSPARRPGPAIALALLLGAAYLLTRVAFAHRFPPFLDEALYANYADIAARSPSRLFVALQIGQGPLLTWLAVVPIKLGLSPLSAVRSISVLSGLLTALATGWLGHRLWGPLTGWVAATLCVVLPFFLVHDGIGIYEPLVTLEITAALLLQLELARRPSLKVAALLGMLMAAAFLTKQNALPALALMPASLLLLDWRRSGRAARLRTWLLGALLVLVFVVLADALLRSSGYYPALQAARRNIFLWPARTVGQVLRDPFGVLALNWATFRPAMLGYVGAPLLAAALGGALIAWRESARLAAVILAWIVVPFVILMAFELRPFPRHAMYLVPPLLVLAARALVFLSELAHRHLRPPAVALALLAAALLIIVPSLVRDARVLAHPATARYPGLDYWQYVAGWPAGGPWRSAAETVQRRARGRPAVVLTPGGYGILDLLLETGGGRIAVVQEGSPLAASADFGVVSSDAFPVPPRGLPARLRRRGFTPVGVFARPSGPCSGPREELCGGTVTVYARGR